MRTHTMVRWWCFTCHIWQGRWSAREKSVPICCFGSLQRFLWSQRCLRPFFTPLDLARKLKQQRMTIVCSIRKNRKELPPILVQLIDGLVKPYIGRCGRLLDTPLTQNTAKRTRENEWILWEKIGKFVFFGHFSTSLAKNPFQTMFFHSLFGWNR